MATLTLQGTGVNETEIIDNAPDTNRNGGYQIHMGMSPTSTLNRALIKFDLSSIPVGVIITSAVITLTVASTESDITGVFRVYRVLRDWIDSQATWNSYKTGNAWSTAGCGNTTSDREATDVGSANVSAGPSVGSTIDISLTPSKIQEMISGGGFTNNGFLIKNNESLHDRDSYYDSEDATATNKPKLVVTYTTLATGGNAIFFGTNF